jgi:hypothetical protein
MYISMSKCEECGKNISFLKGYLINNEHYCEDCYNKLSKKIEKEKEIERNNKKTTLDNLKKEKQKGYFNIYLFLFLFFITLGLFSIYWIYRTWTYLRDMNFDINHLDKENSEKKYTKDISPILRTLGMIIPIYNLFLLYELYEWTSIYAVINNVETELSGIYLLSSHIAIGFLVYFFQLFFLLIIFPYTQLQVLINKIEMQKKK